ncbi:hypothetical protein [Kitasatospora griseola]|uniref:hypothetical protein n=1 Tax=Kitasatospora griseola TaxID=2064 RepID=UPI0034498A34
MSHTLHLNPTTPHDPQATDFDLYQLADHVAVLLGPSWCRSEADAKPVIQHPDGTRVAFELAMCAAPDTDLILLHLGYGEEAETAEVYVDDDESETLAAVGTRAASHVRGFCAAQGQFGPAGHFHRDGAGSGTFQQLQIPALDDDQAVSVR